jgi:hypothetical protein
VRLELRGTLPDAHVHILERFLGNRSAAEHTQQAREQDRGSLVVQRAERGGVLRGATLQQPGELDFRR